MAARGALAAADDTNHPISPRHEYCGAEPMYANPDQDQHRRNRLLARLPLGDYALLEPRVGCASARGHLGKQVITDDGRRDAACTASWCIGAAQRWLGNDRAARSASLRHGAERDIETVPLTFTAPLSGSSPMNGTNASSGMPSPSTRRSVTPTRASPQRMCASRTAATW
jgi:hypothetical protein